MFGLLRPPEWVAPLLLMCDRRDLSTAIGERPPSPGVGDAGEEVSSADFSGARSGQQEKEFFEPNLYLYDAYPGGIGFSEPLFHVQTLLGRKPRDLSAARPWA